MPIVHISCQNVWSNAQLSKISAIIHKALVESFKIPDSDFNHRFSVFAAENWTIPPGRSNKYLLIEMTIYPGRSKQAKSYLYKTINTELTKIGLNGSEITIILYEPPLENWGANGIRADEEDIGFNLNV